MNFPRSELARTILLIAIARRDMLSTPLCCSDLESRRRQNALIIDCGNFGPLATLLGLVDWKMPPHAFVTIIDDLTKEEAGR